MEGEATTSREMTYGEKAVGLTFNPSGDTKVQEVKELYAKIIDLCNVLRTEAGPEEKSRLLQRQLLTPKQRRCGR